MHRLKSLRGQNKKLFGPASIPFFGLPKTLSHKLSAAKKVLPMGEHGPLRPSECSKTLDTTKSARNSDDGI